MSFSRPFYEAGKCYCARFFFQKTEYLPQIKRLFKDVVIDIDKLNRMQKREDEFQKEERRKGELIF